jgi:hypothetical protein
MTNTFKGEGRALTSTAFQEASETLGVDAAKLWAVFEIEAKRCGFLVDRRPIILFERHIFHKKTKGRFSKEHPEISNKAYGGYNLTKDHQYDRLSAAIKLDREAALWSTSWGLGQIMGFNATAAGFPSLETMVEDICASEDAQLLGVVRFLQSQQLDRALRVADWSSFARGYNGEDYARNKYDERLRGAFHKYSTGPLPDLVSREAQLLLTYLGFEPGLIDGWFGPNSKRALNSFQEKSNMKVTDRVTSADVERLRDAVYKRQ